MTTRIWAGVAIDTVYASFGSKAALLAAAKDAAKGGDDQQIPMFDRPAYRGLGEGAPEQRLTLAARLIAEVNERTAPLDAAWREAAASDPAIAAQLAEREAAPRRPAALQARPHRRHSVISGSVAEERENGPPDDLR